MSNNTDWLDEILRGFKDYILVYDGRKFAGENCLEPWAAKKAILNHIDKVIGENEQVKGSPFEKSFYTTRNQIRQQLRQQLSIKEGE